LAIYEVATYFRHTKEDSNFPILPGQQAINIRLPRETSVRRGSSTIWISFSSSRRTFLTSGQEIHPEALSSVEAITTPVTHEQLPQSRELSSEY